MRRLVATIVGVPLAMATFSHLGISAAQAWSGREFLYADRANAALYDFSLAVVPFCTVTVTLVGASILSIVNAATRRWTDTWAWVCPAAAISWLLFMAAVVPRWGVLDP